MAKPNLYLIIDTETTEFSHVADFAGVVVNSKGEILDQFSCLVAEYYQTERLFFDKNSPLAIWTLAGLKRRKNNYEMMLASGERVLSSINAVNCWLTQIKERYSNKHNLRITAYNYAFDLDKCSKSGINLSGFNTFCLWQAALGNITHKRAYKNHVLENHLFNKVTKSRNATYSTNAENVAWFCKGFFEQEKHEALSDILDFELAILLKVIKSKNWYKNSMSYSWHKHQLRDHYKVR